MAIHRYKESVLDNKIQRLNQKLEDTINQLEVERRERTEEKQNLLNQIAEHTEYLDQNLSSYIAKAIGLKQIGLGSQDILEQTLGNALQDYLKHSDKIKKKQELEREAEFKRLQEDLMKAQRELQKKTANDIAMGDIEVEHANSEE